MSGTLTWSYTIATPWGDNGAVTVTTADTPDGGGNYAATGISGTWNGAAIIALDGYAGADNLLNPTSPAFANGLDDAGLSFTTTRSNATLWVNLYANGPGDFEVSVIDDPTLLAYTYFNSGPAASVTLTTSCYLRGTRILTTSGEVAIEDLRPGDLVITRIGEQRPVRWIGRQSFHGAFLGADRAPVRVLAGALGDNVPHRDLIVSPDHSLMFDNQLVHAGLLVNGVTIIQHPTADQVEYLHIDLGVHDCVLAEGAWAESYAEQANRNGFHNAVEHAAAFPAHAPIWQGMCLPQIRGADPALTVVRQQIAAHMPHAALTDSADLHLLVDGLRLDPVDVLPDGWVFDIPAGIADMHLVSRGSRPSLLGLAADSRRLGICVTSLTAQSCTAAMTLLPASRLLGAGFHPAEGNQQRWTDGNACLPPLLLVGGAEPVRLTVSGHALPRYMLEPSEVLLAA